MMDRDLDDDDILPSPDLRFLDLAKQRDLEPLAQYIERGGELSPETRNWLAAYLRDDVIFPRNRPPTRAKQLHHFRVWTTVLREVESNGGKPNKAFEVTAADLDMNPKTVETIYRQMERYFGF